MSRRNASRRITRKGVGHDDFQQQACSTRPRKQATTIDEEEKTKVMTDRRSGLDSTLYRSRCSLERYIRWPVGTCRPAHKAPPKLSN